MHNYHDIKHLLPNNHTPINEPGFLEGSILDRFQNICEKFGKKQAVTDGNDFLTYSSLNQQSEFLAGFLLESFGKEKGPVTLLFAHGLAYNIAQFAVLKAGKFYANLDAILASEKLAQVHADIGARLILCDSLSEAKANLLRASSPDSVVVNVEKLCLKNTSSSLMDSISIHPDDIAYLIYTSGSTGAPKGVVVTHRNVLFMTKTFTNYLHLSSDDRALQICPLWTAASGAEIFPVLLNGGTLFPYSTINKGIAALPKLLNMHCITILTAVPSVFRLIMATAQESEKFDNVRLVRLSGDRGSINDIDLFRRHFSDRCLLRIAYAASEAHIISQCFFTTTDDIPWSTLPVGFPMDGVEISIIREEDGQKANPLEIGEVVVSSEYLSRGYWNQDSLTSNRFMVCEEPDSLRKRRYFTSDLGMLDNNGCLHHMGRNDGRIKISGKFVYLKVVEETILQLPEVNQVVVAAEENQEDSNAIRLVAYIKLADTEMTERLLRKKLIPHLPLDSFPAKIHFVSDFRYLSNGKIDRSALKSTLG